MRQVSNSGLVGSFKVDMNINVTSDTSRNDDDVASNYFDLTISSPLGNDACNLPIAAGNILNGNYIYVGCVGFVRWKNCAKMLLCWCDGKYVRQLNILN